MSLVDVIGVGLLGGIGALARFAIDAGVSRRIGRDFPFGTLSVNLLGSFVLGVLAAVSLGGRAYLWLATGLIGAFTTFSTWMFETHRLGEDGRLGPGVVNVLLSLVLGLPAVWAGRHLGAAL
jgi:CrcB protein